VLARTSRAAGELVAVRPGTGAGGAFPSDSRYAPKRKLFYCQGQETFSRAHSYKLPMAFLIPFPGRATAARRFERLLQPRMPAMYRLAYHLTGSRDDAEDLVQEVCTRLYPRLQELEKVEVLGPWLARVVYNQFVDQRRRRDNSPVECVGELPEQASELPGPEELADSQLQQEQILQALSRLSVEHRALIAWHDVEGYTLEELAGREGLAIGTLKSRLHRARAHLRKLLGEPFSPSVRVRDTGE